MTVDKAALQAELARQLEAALELARRAHAAATEGAIHTEARAENAKDTRGLEQSYLARGQAQRVAELEAALAAVGALAVRAFAEGDPIALGAVVAIEDDGEPKRLFLAPHGGGSVLAGGVQVVTPSAPLGRALLGRRIDDEVELRLPAGLRTLVIVDVA
ncbi:MAG TPA: GreA/GreB family elongation factor [Kofleriaceae bacterium]|nr:GreA/GreB family elongation factor [Kofleriaceae bacterium]